MGGCGDGGDGGGGGSVVVFVSFCKPTHHLSKSMLKKSSSGVSTFVLMALFMFIIGDMLTDFFFFFTRGYNSQSK